jgi:hypothetical protein
MALTALKSIDVTNANSSQNYSTICQVRLETNCSVEFRSQVHEDKVKIF